MPGRPHRDRADRIEADLDLARRRADRVGATRGVDAADRGERVTAADERRQQQDEQPPKGRKEATGHGFP
jgi:hypothetical protein